MGQIVRAALQHAGYKVVVAANGIEALNYILEHHPAGIVLDLVLPRLPGYEICALIRKSPSVSHTPVVIISGMGTDDSKMRSFELGADDYVTKPFRIDELIARVDAVMRRAAQTSAPTPFVEHANS